MAVAHYVLSRFTSKKQRETKVTEEQKSLVCVYFSLLMFSGKPKAAEN